MLPKRPLERGGVKGARAGSGAKTYAKASGGTAWCCKTFLPAQLRFLLLFACLQRDFWIWLFRACFLKEFHFRHRYLHIRPQQSGQQPSNTVTSTAQTQLHGGVCTRIWVFPAQSFYRNCKITLSAATTLHLCNVLLSSSMLPPPPKNKPKQKKPQTQTPKHTLIYLHHRTVQAFHWNHPFYSPHPKASREAPAAPRSPRQRGGGEGGTGGGEKKFPLFVPLSPHSCIKHPGAGVPRPPPAPRSPRAAKGRLPAYLPGPARSGAAGTAEPPPPPRRGGPSRGAGRRAGSPRPRRGRPGFPGEEERATSGVRLKNKPLLHERYGIGVFLPRGTSSPGPPRVARLCLLIVLCSTYAQRLGHSYLYIKKVKKVTTWKVLFSLTPCFFLHQPSIWPPGTHPTHTGRSGTGCIALAL